MARPLRILLALDIALPLGAFNSRRFPALLVKEAGWAKMKRLLKGTLTNSAFVYHAGNPECTRPSSTSFRHTIHLRGLDLASYTVVDYAPVSTLVAAILLADRYRRPFACVYASEAPSFHFYTVFPRQDVRIVSPRSASLVVR